MEYFAVQDKSEPDGIISRSKKRNCAGRCCCIVSILLLILLVLSLFGNVAIWRLLPRPSTLVDVLKGIRDCTDCPKCHICLAGWTGQDVPKLCETDDLSTVLQCAKQLYFLYGDNAHPEFPCYEECRACRNCLDTLSLGVFDLEATAWETIYTDYLVDDVELNPECHINCIEIYGEKNCTWTCPTTNFNGTTEFPAAPFGSRRRRRNEDFEDDGDVCCDTERSLTPYVAGVNDAGETFYPVWLGRPGENPPYSFQYYYDINCPRPYADCSSNNVRCLPKAAYQSYLMTTYKPDATYGYYFIIVTFPNKKVKFIAIEQAQYCKCTV